MRKYNYKCSFKLILLSMNKPFVFINLFISFKYLMIYEY